MPSVFVGLKGLETLACRCSNGHSGHCLPALGGGGCEFPTSPCSASPACPLPAAHTRRRLSSGQPVSRSPRHLHVACSASFSLVQPLASPWPPAVTWFVSVFSTRLSVPEGQAWCQDGRLSLCVWGAELGGYEESRVPALRAHTQLQCGWRMGTTPAHLARAFPAPPPDQAHCTRLSVSQEGSISHLQFLF